MIRFVGNSYKSSSFLVKTLERKLLGTWVDQLVRPNLYKFMMQYLYPLSLYFSLFIYFPLYFFLFIILLLFFPHLNIILPYLCLFDCNNINHFLNKKISLFFFLFYFLISQFTFSPTCIWIHLDQNKSLSLSHTHTHPLSLSHIRDKILI